MNYDEKRVHQDTQNYFKLLNTPDEAEEKSADRMYEKYGVHTAEVNDLSYLGKENKNLYGVHVSERNEKLVELNRNYEMWNNARIRAKESGNKEQEKRYAKEADAAYKEIEKYNKKIEKEEHNNGHSRGR